MEESTKATTHPSLRLGTRSSQLALWQAEWVAGELTRHNVDVELIHIQTVGDHTTQPIATVGSQGLFTKEIQRALLDNRIDLAVHSLKDLPTEPVDGLTLTAVPKREHTGDAFVSRKFDRFTDLPAGARVGTGSRRRRSQLLHARPDLVVADIRGNLDTRLRKLDEGDYDAIVLAQAGLHRLGWENRITQVFSPDLMLPAVGQGALGLETRSDDPTSIAWVRILNHAPSHHAVAAERTMLAELRGGCLAPVGAWARMREDLLFLEGVVLSLDGKRRLHASASGVPELAIGLGQQVATELLAQGAEELIAAAKT